jgi:hypothetical protein
LTGNPIECVTFNLSQSENPSELTLNQLPNNEPSRLTIRDETAPSQLRIRWSETNEADFNVLVTDYGKHSHMLPDKDEVFIALSENFAGFFICKDESDQKFSRAAAILSRTKTLADDKRKVVKELLNSYGITDEDLTIVITCD